MSTLNAFQRLPGRTRTTAGEHLRTRGAVGQYGKNDLAVHLFEWEPELLFEVQARHLKLLRLKAGRSKADKVRLTPVMDQRLAGLITVDLARAAVVCGQNHRSINKWKI